MTSKLQKAIEQGSLEAVVAALDSGADIEEADMHGYPGLPLRIACFNGHNAIVLELLRRGANIHAVNHDGPGAPIRMAVRGQHRETINLLVEHGADIPPGMDLRAIVEKISNAKPAAADDPHSSAAGKDAAIERHSETQIKEVEVFHWEFERLFGNASPKTEPTVDDHPEDGWDKLKRLD